MSMVTAETRVVVSLSQEELLFLLQLCRVPSLPGLDLDAFDRLSEPERAITLTAGERSLRARGLLEDSSEAEAGVAVGDVVLAALGTCVMARAIVTVDRWPVDDAGERLAFYFGEEMVVEHEVLEHGIHRFTSFFDQSASLFRLLGAAGVPETSEEATPPLSLSLPRLTVENARQEVIERMDAAAATRLLAGADVDEGAASAFAETLSRLESASTLTLLSERNGQADGHGVVLLTGGGSTWLLDPDAEESGPVLCKRVSSSGLADWLRSELGLPPGTGDSNDQAGTANPPSEGGLSY